MHFLIRYLHRTKYNKGGPVLAYVRLIETAMLLEETHVYTLSNTQCCKHVCVELFCFKLIAWNVLVVPDLSLPCGDCCVKP